MIAPEWSDNGRNGGIGTYSRIVASAAAASGHTVTVFTADAGRSEIGDGFRIVPVPAPTEDAAAAAAEFHSALGRLESDELPDVIEAADYCGAAALIAEDPSAPPVTTRLHLPLSVLLRRNGRQRIYGDDDIRRNLEHRQIRTSAQLTSPTRWLAREVMSQWELLRPPIVVPNPIPPDWLVTGPGQPRTGRPEVLYFGRLEFRKGVITLAEAVAEHFAAGSAARMTFLGRDTRWRGYSMVELIRKRLESVPDPASYRILPACSWSTLVRHIDDSDLVVLPSRYENFPYSCLEAMARGRPVLATTGSGFEEIIDHGRTGFLVAPNDPSALANALDDCLSDLPRLAGVGAAARNAVERYAAATVVPRLLDVYGSLRRRHADGVR